MFLTAEGLLALVALLGFLSLRDKRGYDKDADITPTQDPGDLGSSD